MVGLLRQDKAIRIQHILVELASSVHGCCAAVVEIREVLRSRSQISHRSQYTLCWVSWSDLTKMGDPDDKKYFDFDRYFLGNFLQIQLFRGMCEASLGLRFNSTSNLLLHKCDIYGSRNAGKFLRL